MDDEVFSFNMSLTPKATEGEGYTDTSKVDGKVKLNVGCIQVVYLQKFFLTLVVSLNLKYTPTGKTIRIYLVKFKDYYTDYKELFIEMFCLH